MFFHFDTGLNKTTDKWTNWAMVIGVSLHIMLNRNAFKRYFTQTPGKVVVGIFAALLALGFIPIGSKGGGESGLSPPIHALAKAPMPLLAQVRGTAPEALKDRVG